MTATYVAADLATSALYRVRFFIGDVDTAAAMMQDEEINFLLIQNGNDESAVLVNLARALLARYGAQPTSVRLPDGTSADYSDRVAVWQGIIQTHDTANSGMRIRRLARPQAVGGGEYT